MRGRNPESRRTFTITYSLSLLIVRDKDYGLVLLALEKFRREMNPKALLLFTFSVNCVAGFVSILFLLVGPVELRWIFAVWGVTSSILLYFIVKTYRDLKRRQKLNRWILK